MEVQECVLNLKTRLAWESMYNYLIRVGSKSEFIIVCGTYFVCVFIEGHLNALGFLKY